LHLDLASPVRLVDDLLGLSPGIDLHVEPATAALTDQLLELGGGVHEDVAGLEGTGDADDRLAGAGGGGLRRFGAAGQDEHHDQEGEERNPSQALHGVCPPLQGLGAPFTTAS